MTHPPHKVVFPQEISIGDEIKKLKLIYMAHGHLEKPLVMLALVQQSLENGSVSATDSEKMEKLFNWFPKVGPALAPLNKMQLLDNQSSSNRLYVMG